MTILAWSILLAVAFGGPVAGSLTAALFYAAERIDNGFQRLRKWRWKWFAETSEKQLDNLVEVLHRPVPHEAAEIRDWPQRQTPTDLAEAYQPVTLRESLILQRPEPITELIRAEVDSSGCNVPCTARHCAEHNAPGTEAQQWLEARIVALTTDTKEWDLSLLGLRAPSIEDLAEFTGSAT